MPWRPVRVPGERYLARRDVVGVDERHPRAGRYCFTLDTVREGSACEDYLGA
jgi:hypothetical protein